MCIKKYYLVKQYENTVSLTCLGFETWILIEKSLLNDSVQELFVFSSLFQKAVQWIVQILFLLLKDLAVVHGLLVVRVMEQQSPLLGDDKLMKGA
jgi:hypothetical protein